jgi:hypothetical protein
LRRGCPSLQWPRVSSVITSRSQRLIGSFSSSPDHLVETINLEWLSKSISRASSTMPSDCTWGLAKKPLPTCCRLLHKSPSESTFISMNIGIVGSSRLNICQVNSQGILQSHRVLLVHMNAADDHNMILWWSLLPRHRIKHMTCQAWWDILHPKVVTLPADSWCLTRVSTEQRLC